jgi:chromosome segregation ATPase
MSFGVEFTRKNGVIGYYERKMNVFNPTINMRGTRDIVANTNQLETKKVAQENSDNKVSEEDIKNLEEKIEKKDEELKEVKDNLRELKIECFDLKESTRLLEKQNLELIEELESSKAEALGLKATLKKAGSSKLDFLIEENENLRKETQQKLREERQLGEDRKKAHNEEIERLNKRIATMQKDIDDKREIEIEHTKVVEEWRLKVEEKQKEIDDNKNRIEDKYTHFDELNKYIGDLLTEKKKTSKLLDEKIKRMTKMEFEIEELEKQKEVELSNLNEKWKKKSRDVESNVRIPMKNEIRKKNEQIESLKLQLRLTEKLLGTGDTDLIRDSSKKILKALDEIELYCKSKNMDFLSTDIIGKKQIITSGKKGEIMDIIDELSDKILQRLQLLTG